MPNYHPFFLENLHRFSRGGAWLRGQELGRLPPGAYDQRPFRVLLTRLSTYEDTSLSFTHNFLYALLAAEGWFPDLAFLPQEKDRELLAEAGVPWFFGTGTKRSWQDFDVLAVSNSITQELGNLYWFYQKSGLPHRKSQRLDRPDVPLVILGGANAGSASVLLHPDPLVDGIFVGEDHLQIVRLFGILAEGRRQGLPKADVLLRLEEVPGFFQPDKVRPVKKFTARDLAQSSVYQSLPVNYGEGNADKAVLAISEGCAGFCSFCSESFVRKPYREGPAAELVEQALRIKAATGASRLDLFSFNFNMHREFYPLLQGLLPLFGQIGLKSQRFDSLAEDPTLVEVEKILGKTYFTCGMEGVSERLRRYLNKNLSWDQIRRSLEVLYRANIRELKIFLIATGLEQPEDLAEFGQFLQGLKGLKTGNGKTVRVVFSVTPIVHFPHTPLEFAPASPPKALDKILRAISRTAEDLGFECRSAVQAEESAVSDLLLRARGPEFYEAWLQTLQDSGFVYDREIPEWFYRHFVKNLSARGWTEDRLFGEFSFQANAKAPWALLDMGLKRSFLEHQYGKNSQFEEISPNPELLCGKKPESDDYFWADRFREQYQALKKQEERLDLHCRLGPAWSHLSRDYPVTALMRAVFQAEPGLVPGYRGYAGGFWEGKAGETVLVTGEDRLGLLFLSQAAKLARQKFQDSGWLAALNQVLADSGSDLEVIGLAPREPKQTRLQVDSPHPFNAQLYLLGQGLKHVYTKTPAGRYAFAFTKDALKKQILVNLESERTGGPGIRLHVTPGSKFSLRELLQRGLAGPGKNDWQKVTVSATMSF